MASLANPAPVADNAKNTGNGKNQARRPHVDELAPAPYRLTPEREEELTVEAQGLGDKLLLFPGKLARRVAWASRIQLAAERDSADLVRTPFADEEPPLTLEEILGQRDRIEFLRASQSRWQIAYRGTQTASASFEQNAAEATQHRLALLRFFDLRFKNDLDGQRRLSAIRAGSGDADLIQDVSDLLILCAENRSAVEAGPRGEGESATRLSTLSPLLSRLLADKALSPEAQQSRRSRDAAYTLVMNTERRLRAAATYWYDGTDKLAQYAPFTSSTGTAATPPEEEEETTPIEAVEPHPIPVTS